jgi:hypothetical protein
MKKLILLAISATLLCAQTANVYNIPVADAAEGLKLYQAMLKAQDQFVSWKQIEGAKVQGDVQMNLEYTPDFKHAIVQSAVRSITLGNFAPLTDRESLSDRPCAATDISGNCIEF